MGSLSKLRPSRRREYLESFPEEVYDLSDTSHLVRFVDALCDKGVGHLRKQLLMNRLQTSLDETSGNDLDSFYGDLFGLKRLPDECYTIDGTPYTAFTTNGLLNSEQFDVARDCDAKYRRRIWTYITALPMSGTLAGVRRAASAALGCDCSVLESQDFYGTNGIAPEREIAEDRLITIPAYDEPSSRARYDSVLIVADKDDVTQFDLRYLTSALKRIMPQDVVLKLVSKNDANELFCLSPEPEQSFVPQSVYSSSRWWERARYVTGAEDWSYEYDPDRLFWIEPNIRKEAPMLSETNSQEFVTDYTFMTEEITATSEHVGQYNWCQAQLYPVLTTAFGESYHQASDALASTFGKTFATSLSSNVGIIDDSYPIDYLPAVLPQYHEEDRGRRMWSSAERKGVVESIEFKFAKDIPLNRVAMKTLPKPFVLRCEYMSDGEWASVSLSGQDVVYTCDSWGGDSLAGSEMSLTFDFDTVMASRVRLSFERTQETRAFDNGDGTFIDMDMTYSVEASDVTFLYRCLNEFDFVPSAYPDVFGNLVETELRTYDVESVLDNSRRYWLSQPNPTQDCVEYIVFDVRDSEGNPQTVDFIDIDAVIGGCQMNVYSAYEDQWGGHVWYPYPGIFKLKDGRYELEERKVSFIKLEFTNLSTIPYRVADDGIKVGFRTFPPYARNVDDGGTGSYRWTYLDQLLETQRGPSASSAAASERYLKTGMYDPYAALDSSETLTAQLAANGGVDVDSLWGIAAYRSVFGMGGNTKTEQPIGSTSLTPDWSFDATPGMSFFSKEQEHEYIWSEGTLTADVAYVVAIRSVRFGRSESSTLYEAEGTFYAKTDDARFTEQIYGMEITTNGVSPKGDSLARYESRDFDTTCLFDSFDFAVSQKEPYQVFRRPSRMAYSGDPEWTSIRDGREYSLREVEMGSSGLVARLAREGGAEEGIESEQYLVRADGIAQFHVRLFDYGPKTKKSRWYVDCTDGVETLFSMPFLVERGGWHSLNVNFQIVPASGWWNDEYHFRTKLNISAGQQDLPIGTSLFFPCLDMLSTGTDLVHDQQGNPINRVRDDLKDLRLVYYDGTSSREIPSVVTGNHELWFRLQQTIRAGESASGVVDKKTHAFKGAYYLYYGNPEETRERLDNIDEVFEPALMVGDYEDDDLCSFDADSGYVTFDFTPNSSVLVGNTNTYGKLFEWESPSGGMKVDMHVYQDTLVFEVFDGEFRSSVSGSLDNGDFVKDETVRILGQYGPRGSANHEGQDDSARGMKLTIRNLSASHPETGKVLADTLNVYDMVEYDYGQFRNDGSSSSQ